MLLNNSNRGWGEQIECGIMEGNGDPSTFNPPSESLNLAARFKNYRDEVQKRGSMDTVRNMPRHFPPTNPPWKLRERFVAMTNIVNPKIISNIYEIDPERLAGDYGENEEKKWFFFTLRGRKYMFSEIVHRVGGDGYWRFVNPPEFIHEENKNGVVGYCRYYAYYKGKHPNGIVTDWMMKEYRLNEYYDDKDEQAQIGNWVLCTIEEGRHLRPVRGSPSIREVHKKEKKKP